MNQPLVSVICLCYNQNQYVVDSIQSVLAQDYAYIQLIIVDDASRDGSQRVIDGFLNGHSSIPFVSLNENIGNTGAFNKGLELATGKYVVDLAADDMLLPTRVSEQVAFFEDQDERVGVIYSDAEYISEEGEPRGKHYDDPRWTPCVGNIYTDLVSGYFIHPAAMMIKKMVLDELGGYDAELAYEDFDFWVRSARIWNYAYQGEVLTQIRQVRGSQSTTLYKRGDNKLASTVLVCRKIQNMNQNAVENMALAIRLQYEIKHAFMTGHREATNELLKILNEIGVSSWEFKLLKIFNWGINFSFFRSVILKAKYH